LIVSLSEVEGNTLLKMKWKMRILKTLI